MRRAKMPPGLALSTIRSGPRRGRAQSTASAPANKPIAVCSAVVLNGAIAYRVRTPYA